MIIGAMRLAKVIVQLPVDITVFAWLLLRPSRSLASENLFLRKQLAMFQERGVKPCRPSAADRISLAVLQSNIADVAHEQSAILSFHATETRSRSIPFQGRTP
jgi:hypothetical protein